jgi:hypothetical protein
VIADFEDQRESALPDFPDDTSLEHAPPRRRVEA